MKREGDHTSAADPEAEAREAAETTESPARLGFFAPAEIGPHARGWLAWPVEAAEWPDYEAALETVVRLANTISEYEPVAMVCPKEKRAHAEKRLSSAIELLEAPLNDSWMRDIGPTFIVDSEGRKAAIDWRFNGWGEKWPHDDDDRVAALVARHAEVPLFRSRLVMEGGAFQVDGEGTCLVTEECLLNRNRNPELSRQEIEEQLCQWLGVTRVVWLPYGLVDDHTDGHVDEVACFWAPGRVLVVAASRDAGPDRERLASNRRCLGDSVDAKGRALEVFEIAAPPQQLLPDGRRMSLSYLNFYPANDAILLPSFRSSRDDDRARGQFAELFPERRIETIDALPICANGGGIHCLTQQEPLAVVSREGR